MALFDISYDCIIIVTVCLWYLHGISSYGVVEF